MAKIHEIGPFFVSDDRVMTKLGTNFHVIPRMVCCFDGLRKHFKIPLQAKKIWLAAYDRSTKDTIKITTPDSVFLYSVVQLGDQKSWTDVPPMATNIIHDKLKSPKKFWLGVWYEE